MRSVSPVRLMVTALLVAAGGSFLASGCADNDSSLFIAGVMAEEGSCVFEPEADSIIRGSGTLDVAVSSTYSMPLLLGNQLIARGDAEKLRTETARIAIRGAVVTVIQVEGNTTRENFSTNANGFVNPATGSTPGYGVAVVTAIPSKLGEALAAELAPGAVQELNVAVSVYGDTLGGDEVESSTITFPVFVCNGCLIDCSTANPIGGCTAFPEEELTVGCFPGQDALVPCQYAKNPGSVCLAP